MHSAKCVNSIVEFIFNESLCEKRDLWVLQTVHSAYWKALSTVYFASQEVVGPVYSAQNPLTDVMECFSVQKKKKKKKLKTNTPKRSSYPNAA